MVKLPYVCRSLEPGTRYLSSMYIFENRIGKVGREEKRQRVLVLKNKEELNIAFKILL